jgi:hypothetical protein
MVYLAKKNGVVIAHTDKQAMRELDGIEKPDMTVTDAEWEVAGGLARIINNKIVLGKTNEEKAEEEKQNKIGEYLKELDSIDQQAVAGRAARGLSLAAAEKAGLTDTEDYKRLHAFEEQADPIRIKLDKLRK